MVLPALGGETDEAALALADGGRQIDDAGRGGVLAVLHEQALVGEHRGQVGELRAQGHDLGGHAVDGRHLLQGRELVVGARRARRARDHVALEQAVLADGGEPHVDVVLAGQVAGGAQKAVAVAHDVQHAGDLGEALGLADGLVDGVHQLGLLQARGIHPGLGGASAQVGPP